MEVSDDLQGHIEWICKRLASVPATSDTHRLTGDSCLISKEVLVL